MAEQRVWKGDSEGSINSVNQWMRSQPWWAQYLQSIGQDPGNTKLSKSQAKDLLKLAQANGVQVDEGNIEVDPAGNFNPIGHKMRNALIGGAIGAGAAFGAPALLGALGGGGGAGAAGAAGVAGASGGGAALATPALTSGLAGGLGAGSMSAGALAGALPGAVTTGMASALPGALSATQMAGAAPKVGLLGKITGMASMASPILSDMAAQGQAANERRDQMGIAAANAQLGRDTFGLKAPGERMHQGLMASLLQSASPSKTEWGGPGSGLRGEVPRATGGASSALSRIAGDVGPLASAANSQLLAKQQQNADYTDPNLAKVGKTSLMDKLVGGAATGAGLLKLASVLRKK